MNEGWNMVDYKLIVSGTKWIQGNVLSTEKAIKQIIDESYGTLLMTIYIFTNEELLKHIVDALNRNVDIEIYVYENDDLQYKKILYKLKSLENVYSNLNLHISVEEFIHAKVLIADTVNVIIGSANLTHNGLKSNYELGIFLKDEEIAYDVERIIKRL